MTLRQQPYLRRRKIVGEVDVDDDSDGKKVAVYQRYFIVMEILKH